MGPAPRAAGRAGRRPSRAGLGRLVRGAPRAASGDFVSPTPFPYTALVGQATMRLALELAVVDPTLGGVLLSGEEGTGRTTAVLGLADVLPRIRVVRGCPYNSDPTNEATWGPGVAARAATGPLPRRVVRTPLVEVPLGVSEDRLLGSIDLDAALSQGRTVFDPGLLARANRGILFIDDIHLIDDTIVDCLLDVAASGRNVVEREGISVVHPARFVLVATSHLGDAPLRPQILDRFGLSVEVRTLQDIDDCVQIVERVLDFTADEEGFASGVRPAQALLTRRLARARRQLPHVVLPRSLALRVSEACSELGLDGLRGDISTCKAARALSALDGRSEVALADVVAVAPLACAHRVRPKPLHGGPAPPEAGLLPSQHVERVFGRVLGRERVETASV